MCTACVAGVGALARRRVPREVVNEIALDTGQERETTAASGESYGNRATHMGFFYSYERAPNTLACLGGRSHYGLQLRAGAQPGGVQDSGHLLALPPERDDGYRRGPSVMCATVPQGTVATTVAQDWLANELAEYGEIDAACRDRFVMHLMTAAGASAPADAVFGFKAGETMQTSRPTSASGEDDDEDTGSEEYSDDRASDR